MTPVSPHVRWLLGPGQPEVIAAADEFSPCRRFRYWLRFTWNHDADPLVVIGQNPSKASRERRDGTVTRCARRAHTMGSGGLLMLNLFPYMATDPSDLWAAGPFPTEEGRNIEGIAEALVARPAAPVLLACGGDPHPRQGAALSAVVRLLAVMGRHPLVLGVTASGMPRHPSRMGYGVAPMPWTGWQDHAQ